MMTPPPEKQKKSTVGANLELPALLSRALRAKAAIAGCTFHQIAVAALTYAEERLEEDQLEVAFNEDTEAYEVRQRLVKSKFVDEDRTEYMRLSDDAGGEPVQFTKSMLDPSQDSMFNDNIRRVHKKVATEIEKDRSRFTAAMNVGSHLLNFFTCKKPKTDMNIYSPEGDLMFYVGSDRLPKVVTRGTSLSIPLLNRLPHEFQHDPAVWDSLAQDLLLRAAWTHWLKFNKVDDFDLSMLTPKNLRTLSVGREVEADLSKPIGAYLDYDDKRGLVLYRPEAVRFQNFEQIKIP